jgi:two-component system cell cycle sensor histidine kinase/response regulator CckA
MQPVPSTREMARVELVRHAVLHADAQERAFLHAAKLTARTLKVERVGIWLLEADDTMIRCQLLYELSADRVSETETIDLRACPSYAAALLTWRAVAASDARHDPRTRELSDYLQRHEITSLLDSPIFQQGKPVGVVCHEHVGAPRAWTKEERNFAATVSDMLGLYLEQAEVHRTFSSLLDAQAELERARVMESLGRMALAVAHDFNNVLSAIGLRSELSMLPADEPTARDAYVKEIHELVGQGSRLVRQLVAFARSDHPGPREVVDLAAVVLSMRVFLGTLEEDGISVRLRLASEPAWVALGRTEVEQIITNLAINACDAMLGGGVLTIEVSRGERPLNGGDGHAAQEPRACLRVADTGVGMDEYTQQRVFEPFFSTKGAQHGAGLGLATVYRLVIDSGGSVGVESALGEGASFKLEWPLAEPPVTHGEHALPEAPV